jgi:hypothetical protein
MFATDAMASWAAKRGVRLAYSNRRTPAMRGSVERLFQSVVAEIRGRAGIAD